MPNVDINGTTVEFPDSLSPDELNQAVGKAASQMGGSNQPQQTGPDWKSYTSTIARPLLEAGGAVGGGIAGSALGPMGTAGGGVLGYGMGKAGADLLDRSLGVKQPIQSFPEALKETGEDVKQGGINEAVGLGMGKVIPPLFSKAGKVASQFGEYATNVPSRIFKTVAENPTSIFPGQLEKAGNQFGEAMNKSGISDKLTPELSDILKSPKPYAFDTFKKLQESGSITPQEALYGKRAIDAIYPIPTQKNGAYIRMLDQMKSAFDGIISSQTPELKEASKDYAIAKAGSKFQSLFPQTNSGKPSYFKTSAIGAGLLTGHPTAALGIPAVAGGLTATVGPAGKAVSELASEPTTAPMLAQPVTNKIGQWTKEKEARLQELRKKHASRD